MPCLFMLLIYYQWHGFVDKCRILLSEADVKILKCYNILYKWIPGYNIDAS